MIYHVTSQLSKIINASVKLSLEKVTEKTKYYNIKNWCQRDIVELKIHCSGSPPPNETILRWWQDVCLQFELMKFCGSMWFCKEISEHIGTFSLDNFNTSYIQLLFHKAMFNVNMFWMRWISSLFNKMDARVIVLKKDNLFCRAISQWTHQIS